MKQLLLIVMLVAAVGAQAAPKTAVFNFVTSGIDEATGATATSVFRTELANTGKFDVIDVGDLKAALGGDPAVEGVAQACEYATKLGALKAVIGTMSRLGEQTLIEVKLIDVLDAKVEFNDRLGTTSQSDIDVILTRLARGLASRKKAQTTAEVGTVTQKETEEPARRASFWSGGGRIGYLLPVGGFGNNPGFPLGGTVVAAYETPDFMAEASYAGYGITSRASLWTAGFSAFKMMSHTDVCPYFGGGINLGMAGGDFDSYMESPNISIGPVVNFGGGMMFFRTYDFRLVADLRYYLSFSQIKSWDGNSTYSALQHGPALSVGLLYKKSKTDNRGGCCFLGF